MPLHCASFCFRNRPELVAVDGVPSSDVTAPGRLFSRTRTLAQPDTNLTDGYAGFDKVGTETYVHYICHNDV